MDLPGKSLDEQRPPMGWNSFDCYNASVVEDEVKENAEALASSLKPFGWEYVVVDFCWSHPSPRLLWSPDLDVGPDGELTPRLTMDAWGRQVPAPNRFPSSSGGQGFKPLADYIHNLGLKFGLHVMRGIPRQAVQSNLPVLGTGVCARDIADLNSTCLWLNHMVGIDMSKAGAQAYYDSLFELFAAWGVDLIKVDDISYPYIAAEVEAVQQAIMNCGRQMVLSLSPGPTPIDQAAHVCQHATMWRISADFWDSWEQLRHQLYLAMDWLNFSCPGHYPDCDILPLGLIELRGPISPSPHPTHFTPDEQVFLMTLCAIIRSPLMFGGHLPSLDAYTLKLLTNPEVLRVNQLSTANRLWLAKDGYFGCCAEAPNGAGTYLAVFNTNDTAGSFQIQLEDLRLSGSYRVRDLWQHLGLQGETKGSFTPCIPAHGAGLWLIDNEK